MSDISSQHSDTTMSQTRCCSTFLCSVLLYGLAVGQCVEVILGDPFTFPVDVTCTGEVTLAYRTGPHRTRQVAVRSEGAWKPSEDYEDRMKESVSLSFKQAVYNDAGAYELTCSTDQDFLQIMQLKVVVPYEASVEEGGRVQLRCYHHTGLEAVESVQWTKDRKLVFERKFSSSKDTYGVGDGGNMSMPAAGYSEGDLSLILDQAGKEHAGVYRCSAFTAEEGQGGNEVSAVRLKVKEGARKQNNESTGCPPENPAKGKATPTWIVISSTALMTALICVLLGLVLKRRCFNIQS